MLLIATEIGPPNPPPNQPQDYLFIKTVNGVKEKKRIKTNIGVGSVVKVKVRYMEEKTREGRIRIKRKEVAECVQDMERRKKFLF